MERQIANIVVDQSPERIADFSANLRFLCERQGTISNLCRRIGLNRQQFNKYLSGLHLPSPQNLRLIANFFGLGVSVLFSDPEEFRTLIEGNFFHAMENLRKAPELNKFLSTMTVASKFDVASYVGSYDRYQYSSIYRGRVLKSAFCIYQSGDFLQHYYIERFPSYEVPRKTEYVFKYHGFVFPVAERMFSIDFEVIQRNEFTFGTFVPVLRNAKKFMFGIATGIAANPLREPFATKVVLRHRGPGLLRREQLKALTVLDRSDPLIPKEVLQFLGDGSDMMRIS
jgi:transcriptional regulator with XRE-family HTH domain